MRQWIVGVVLVVSAGCSGLPMEPAGYRDPGAGVPSSLAVASPVAGVAPLVPRAPESDTAPAPAPEPEEGEDDSTPAPAEPPSTPPVEGPCGLTPCAPPVDVTCPAGLLPVLGVSGAITCEAPPAEVTCPAGTQPALGETLTCEPI